MAVVTKGVFPVHAGSFEVDTSETPHTTPVWSKVAELEEVNVEIDNTTETWSSFSAGGWQSALVTGKATKITLKGKMQRRCRKRFDCRKAFAYRAGCFRESEIDASGWHNAYMGSDGVRC